MVAPQASESEVDDSEGQVPSAPAPRVLRVWLVAALCALALYLPSMAPGVLWGDSGDAQVRVLAGAIRD